MAKKFLVPLNVSVLSSDPVSGSEGDIYFNNINKVLKVYKNGLWEEVGSDNSASLIAYIDLQIDDVYDVLYGNFLEADDTTDLIYSLDTDDMTEGVSNLYFTDARAINAVIPSQEGNSGKYLTTDGASVSWATVESIGTGLPSQTGNGGKYLTTDGASASWAILDLDAGIQAASVAATASAISYTDEQIALFSNDPTIISFTRWNKVISSSSSTISGLDDDGETLSYVPGIEQVFINGSFIDRDSYTATSGNSITFDEPLNDTDIVEVICLKSTSAITEEQLATSVDRWTKIMSASTSTISGLDDYNNTLDYSIGYTTLYVNGVLIDPSEYTATSGSAIVLNTSVNADDVVEVLSYKSVGYLWNFYSLLNSASAAAVSTANSYTDSEISALDIFSTIETSPATQSIVADSNSDTLTFIAGENISITAASASDSITINSTGNYTSVDSIQYPDYIAFDNNPSLTSASPGTIFWDGGEGTLDLILNENIDIALGQEIIVKCYNGEATALNKGEVVMVSGAQGQRPRVIRAYNTSDAGSARTFGIVAENINSGEEGFIVTQGIVKGIDTDAFNEGDILYLSATPGQLTTVKPQAPNHYVFVGVVLSKNISSGRIYVKPQNGYELDEIHDVRITSVQNDDLIVYNSASSIWINSPKQDIINTASAAAVSYLVDGAPEALDTLNELAAALDDNADILDLYLTQSSASTLYATKAELENIDALPDQENNEGKFLTTDGASASWATIVTGSASFFRWTKTISASTTLIDGADDNAINLEYTPGLEQVYINGVMIARPEYTATSGSTIVLNEAVSVNDVVDIFGYTSINTTSTYSQAQIDAKYNQYTRWKKIYSASATVISGNDDNSLPLTYTSGYEQVYLNGILLTPITDYARTSASVITLGQAVVTNDVIEIINTQPFNVANTYTTTQADNIFLTQNSASSTFLTNSNASSTYSTKSSPTFTGTAIFDNIVINGTADISEMVESVSDVSIVSGSATLNYSSGNIFYISSASSNFTANLTNVPTTNGKTITVSIIVTQGSTGYIPNVFSIDGSPQTIKWSAGITPTPTSSSGKIDIFNFTLIRRSSTWTVFGTSSLNF